MPKGCRSLQIDIKAAAMSICELIVPGENAAGRGDLEQAAPDTLVLRSAEFLGESDEKPFRPPDVAEPIHVLILDDFADELRAARAEPFKRLVDVVHGEHDAEVAQGVDRGVPVICDDRRPEEAGELERRLAGATG
jgi:hypothetical protein